MLADSSRFITGKDQFMTKHIDDQTITDFRASGVTVLRGVFLDWVETLRAGTAWNIENPGLSARSYQGENGEGLFHSDYCNWQRVIEYQDFIFNSPVAEIAAELMLSKTVRLFHEHILIKDAETDVGTPWHQDQPYYCVAGPKTVSLWIPLDPVSRDRTLEFVAGSHEAGNSYQPQYFDGRPLNEDDILAPVPDIDANRVAYDIRGWEVLPGDAVAFDYRTIHGAPANHSCTQRRVFSLRLIGDNAQFVLREGMKTSPPFPDVSLECGAPLEGEEFPLLFPRD